MRYVCRISDSGNNFDRSSALSALIEHTFCICRPARPLCFINIFHWYNEIRWYSWDRFINHSSNTSGITFKEFKVHMFHIVIQHNQHTKRNFSGSYQFGINFNIRLYDFLYLKAGITGENCFWFPKFIFYHVFSSSLCIHGYT